MNEDFTDALVELISAQVRFLVVGAHALAVHGVPRATGDLDLWIDSGAKNAQLTWAAMARFGVPLESLGVTVADLMNPKLVIQIGLPPRRIDLLTSVSGLEFKKAWLTRVNHKVQQLDVPFLGREALLTNKRATGRAKDLADIEALENSGD